MFTSHVNVPEKGTWYSLTVGIAGNHGWNECWIKSFQIILKKLSVKSREFVQSDDSSDDDEVEPKPEELQSDNSEGDLSPKLQRKIGSNSESEEVKREESDER